jgi:hypothetical protein
MKEIEAVQEKIIQGELENPEKDPTNEEKPLAQSIDPSLTKQEEEMRQKVPENPEQDKRSKEKAFAQLLVKAIEKQQDRKLPKESASGTGTGPEDRYRFK